MIIKTFEINKLNVERSNFYLLYGENEGLKNEIIKNYFEKKFLKKIYRYDEKEILENNESFLDSILSKSFFDDEKLIIISRVSDKIKKIIEEIIEKKITDIKFILSSGILEKKSKLRTFFEKNKNTICIPCYSDNHSTLNSIATNFFKEKKIPISQQTINLLLERSRGDRKNLNNELMKIVDYTISGKKINFEDIFKLTNLAENYNASELADSCLAKNIIKTSNILNENNYNTDDCILIVRTILNKAKRLAKLHDELKDNDINQAINNYRPPIFWKDKEVVKQQMLQWSLKKIKSMIFQISEIELQIKKNSIISLNILSDFLLTKAKK